MFNDPFDVNQELPIDFDETQLNIVLNEKIALLIEQGSPPSSVSHPVFAELLRVASTANLEKRLEVASEMWQNPVTTTTGQIQAFSDLKEMWREIVPTLRILCLSELNDVTSMWWHYADKNKGVVLELESVDEIDSCFLMARPVTY